MADHTRPTTWFCPVCRQPAHGEGWRLRPPTGDAWTPVCSLPCLLAAVQDELVHETRLEEQERIARRLPKRLRGRVREDV